MELDSDLDPDPHYNACEDSKHEYEGITVPDYVENVLCFYTAQFLIDSMLEAQALGKIQTTLNLFTLQWVCGCNFLEKIHNFGEKLAKLLGVYQTVSQKSMILFREIKNYFVKISCFTKFFNAVSQPPYFSRSSR